MVRWNGKAASDSGAQLTREGVDFKGKAVHPRMDTSPFLFTAK